MDEESPLKRRFGYNVKRGTPLRSRRNALKDAAKNYSLDYIIWLLEGNINNAERRSSANMEDPIKKWKEDIDWLIDNYDEVSKT